LKPQRREGWYFGWNIVAAATVLTLLTVGMRMSIGPFFLPMAEDLGFSRSLLSGIVAAGMLCYGIGMPLAGYLVAIRGTRFVLLTGTAIVVASTIWTVLARDPVSFFLAFTSPVALTPVLSRWFVRRRGTALFFLSTGSMAGIAILTPVFSWAIDAVGWRYTLLGFALAFALLALPTVLLVVRDEAPTHADQRPQDVATAAAHAATAPAPFTRVRDALRTATFWQIAFGLFTCGFSMNLMGTHGMPMLMDHGFDAATSSLGIGTIGLVAIFSTMVLGRLSDVMPRRTLLAGIYLVRGIGFFAMTAVTLHWELYTTAAIGGLAWAGSIALSSAILADAYGVRLVGVLYGWTYFGHQVGATISSLMGGWAFDTFGTHWVSFGSASALLVAAAVVSMSLPVRIKTAAKRVPT
jgi:MFS family permease